jgi:hypothetical protein
MLITFFPCAQPMKPLHTFEPGRHQPLSSGTLSFSESDLIASAQVYNPSIYSVNIPPGGRIFLTLEF